MDLAALAGGATLMDNRLTDLTQGHAAKAKADTMLRTQTAFEGFLNRHVADEEDLVVPRIVQYGPPTFNVWSLG